MTKDLLTDLGEEYMISNGLEAASVEVGLYNDSSDGLADNSDVADVSTEPANASYARQSVTFSKGDMSGNWGVDNDSQFIFDFTDVVKGDANDQDVDCAFVTVGFQADDTGDGSVNTHLIANPSLSQTRGIGSIDTLEVAAGDLQIKLD